MVTNAIKQEIWDYIMRFSVRPSNITKNRLEKLKPIIFNDRLFWEDIYYRHGLHVNNISSVKLDNPLLFDHLIGNFWGIITEIKSEHK